MSVINYIIILQLTMRVSKDNDFLTKWNESDKKYLHIRRWDEIIITKKSEEIYSINVIY